MISLRTALIWSQHVAMNNNKNLLYYYYYQQNFVDRIKK